MTRKYRRALVVGKFAPFHKGHQRVIDEALRIADKVLVLVWSNPDFPDMPDEVRAGWIRTLYPRRVIVRTPSQPEVPRFFGQEDIREKPPMNDAPASYQLAFTRRMVMMAGWGRWSKDQVDVVVSAEPYGEDIAASLREVGAGNGGARSVKWQVDAVTLDRSELPISGTILRADVHAMRKWMDSEVYAHFVESAVFLGAESTGKSTLVEMLADQLQTAWVHEYGRAYYEEHGGVMDLDGYVEIAAHHQWLEERAKRDPMVNKWVFVDTNAITTQMFSYLYERAALPELRQLADGCVNRYKHWFVCDDDIPFEQDGWRDCELARSRVQGLIIQDLDRRGIHYTVLKGPLDQRVRQVEAVLRG